MTRPGIEPRSISLSLLLSLSFSLSLALNVWMYIYIYIYIYTYIYMYLCIYSIDYNLLQIRLIIEKKTLIKTTVQIKKIENMVDLHAKRTHTHERMNTLVWTHTHTHTHTHTYIYIYIYIYILWQVSSRIFNFSRYGRSPMRGLLGPRTNEGLKVKEVNVIWMNTRGILNRTNNITRSCFFPFLYICIIHTFFSFKRKHNCDNRQTKNKTNTTKMYRNVEDKSLPILSD